MSSKNLILDISIFSVSGHGAWLVCHPMLKAEGDIYQGFCVTKEASKYLGKVTRKCMVHVTLYNVKVY